MSTCFGVDRENFDFVGYSLRTDEWRYTECVGQTPLLLPYSLRTFLSVFSRDAPVIRDGVIFGGVPWKWGGLTTRRVLGHRWLHWDNTTLHGDFSRRVALELYDHRTDDGTDPDLSENINLAATADPSLLASLHATLVASFPIV